MRRARSESGVSLIEMLVVLTLFATVALIGTSVLAQLLRNERQLAEQGRQADRLAYALALLRADLRAALAVPFQAPDGAVHPAFDAPAGTTGFALSLGGQAEPFDTGPGTARVIWRLDASADVLVRERWPSLTPKAPEMQSPPVPILPGVRAIMVEGYSAATGWTQGFPRQGAPPGTLPLALRVTLTHRDFGPLQTVVALR